MLGAMDRAERRRAILAELDQLGPVVPGSLGTRTTRCQTSGCRCRADPPQLHGPYPTWTHRQNGRQITRTLTAQEAERLRPMIEADRRLHQLVRELETLGLADINRDTTTTKPG